MVTCTRYEYCTQVIILASAKKTSYKYATISIVHMKVRRTHNSCSMPVLINWNDEQYSMLRSFTLLHILIATLISTQVKSLSIPETTFSLFDRFRPSCPADVGSIKRFDPALAENDHPDTIWVAVFRSSNNKPSVFVRDEFFNAMRTATDISPEKSNLDFQSDIIENNIGNTIDSKETPVAVARLTPSLDFENCWTLDNMRCALKKEETNDVCDGGSEHTEALCVAIDSVLIHYLTKNKESLFDGRIRTKATLVSGTLLENRGFQPVQCLSKDMASHVCSLDVCMERYASRVVDTSARSPGARDRAIRICSLLGQIDSATNLEMSESLNNKNDEEEDYDPWAGVKKFL